MVESHGVDDEHDRQGTQWFRNPSKSHALQTIHYRTTKDGRQVSITGHNNYHIGLKSCMTLWGGHLEALKTCSTTKGCLQIKGMLRDKERRKRNTWFSWQIVFQWPTAQPYICISHVIPRVWCLSFSGDHNNPPTVVDNQSPPIILVIIDLYFLLPELMRTS